MNTEVLSLETSVELPQYETPSVRVMSEDEILNSFQVTQAMGTWWGGTISPCTC
jgi:hypothetical protein